MKKVTIIALVIVLLGMTTWVSFDVYKNNEILMIAASPEEKIQGSATKVLWALENGVEPDYNEVLEECKLIDGRYDKADFSFHTLLRIAYSYEDEVPEEIQAVMKQSFLDFKFWMDQPGEDGMCYWSENHQILFAASEYLAGQLFMEEIFSNDGRTGLDHMKMGKNRVLIWLEQRWLYGFTEWYSNVYYKEDLMALSNLIEFSQDEEVVVKSKIVMDLLLHDMVTQSYKGTFLSTSGRSYEVNKKSGHGNRLNRVAEILFGFDLASENNKSGLDLNFIYMENYEVPKVLEEIALDTSDVIIKASNGLDVAALEGEGLLGLNDDQIMMQWGMEAFTNPQVIRNSLDYIERSDMFSNEFLHEFKLLNIGLLKMTGALPLVSEGLNLKTNGVAIQRANTYTYKTEDFMLATAQSYHPGEFADQQHIWTATLSNDVAIFTTHPSVPLSDEGALSGSPNYWVGSGRLPHSVQDATINLTIYNVSGRKGFMEDDLVEYSHAYFPEELMDEVIIDGNYIFGRLGGCFIVMIGKNELSYAEHSTEDLMQMGKTTFWITELSSSHIETFESFRKRIYSNTVNFNDESNQLNYVSGDKELLLTYQDEFMVNDSMINTNYNRFDSPYSTTERKGNAIMIEHNGKKLYLDFYNLKRTVVN